jgi:hypothetical protein
VDRSHFTWILCIQTLEAGLSFFIELSASTEFPCIQVKMYLSPSFHLSLHPQPATTGLLPCLLKFANLHLPELEKEVPAVGVHGPDFDFCCQSSDSNGSSVTRTVAAVQLHQLHHSLVQQDSPAVSRSVPTCDAANGQARPTAQAHSLEFPNHITPNLVNQSAETGGSYCADMVRTKSAGKNQISTVNVEALGPVQLARGGQEGLGKRWRSVSLQYSRLWT